MRKKTYAPAILGITLLLNAACQKDLMPQSEIVRSREDVKTIVEESRDWYKNHVLVESKNLRKGTSDRSMYIGEPSWEEVAFTKISPTIPEFIRYPLKGYKVDVAYTPKMSPKGYREILFRKLRNNNFIVDVIEMHPDESYVSKKKIEKSLLEEQDLRLLMDNHDYTGYFLVYSKDNLLRYGERRENGQVVSRLSF